MTRSYSGGKGANISDVGDHGRGVSMMANVRLDSKLDHIGLQSASQHTVRGLLCLSFYCIMAESEYYGCSWRGKHSFDQTGQLILVNRGGELGVSGISLWCQGAFYTMFATYRINDCDMTTIFLPCELTAVIIVAVYVPPSANVKQVMTELYCNISLMRVVLTGTTRGNYTLGHVYINITNRYIAAPSPTLALSTASWYANADTQASVERI